MEFVKEILTKIGGWPILESKDWNENNFEIKNAVLKFRKEVAYKSDDIFDHNNGIDIESKIELNNFVDENFPSIKETIKSLIKNVAVAYGAQNEDLLTKDIDEILELEESLIYSKINSKDISVELKKFIKWIDSFSPSLLPSRAVKNTSVLQTFESFSTRAFANFFGWRIVSSTLTSTNREIETIFLEYERIVFGKQDRPQRWKKCIETIQYKLPIATEILYSSKYFSEKDKSSAKKLVNKIFDAFEARIKSLNWIDENIKTQMLSRLENLRNSGIQIGMERQNLDNFYESLTNSRIFDDFTEVVLALDIFRADSVFEEKSRNLNFHQNSMYNVKENQLCKFK